MPLTDATRRRWYTAGNKSQRIAAHLDTWAGRQAPGTIVPADDVIISWHPVIDGQNGHPSRTDPGNVHRAIRLLAGHAILRRDDANGHYYVTATRPAVPVS